MFGLSLVSWIAIAVIVAAIVLAYSRRFVAWGLLMGANIVVFLLTEFGPLRFGILGATDPDQQTRAISAIHGELGLHIPQLLALEPMAFLTLLTHMFVHADWFHLLGNMFILFAFGMPFEERIGHRKFIAIYLATGLVAALAQTAFSLTSLDLLMGASGAIFGILGAFAARYPNQVIGVPLPLFIMMIFVRMRVVIGVFVYAAIQAFYIVYSAANADSFVSNTAYFAHVGGLVAGIALGRFAIRAGSTKDGPISVDLVLLAQFARDAPTKETLAHMQRNNDVPEVFQAWLDRFFRTATCPTCGHKVLPRSKGEIVCTQNHRFDVRRKGAVAAAKTA